MYKPKTSNLLMGFMIPKNIIYKRVTQKMERRKRSFVGTVLYIIVIKLTLINMLIIIPRESTKKITSNTRNHRPGFTYHFIVR